ncbi:hypothetical protein ACVGXB_08590, partial [Enterobacter intestinihominis]
FFYNIQDLWESRTSFFNSGIVWLMRGCARFLRIKPRPIFPAQKFNVLIFLTYIIVFTRAGWVE